MDDVTVPDPDRQYPADDVTIPHFVTQQTYDPSNQYPLYDVTVSDSNRQYPSGDVTISDYKYQEPTNDVTVPDSSKRHPTNDVTISDYNNVRDVTSLDSMSQETMFGVTISDSNSRETVSDPNNREPIEADFESKHIDNSIENSKRSSVSGDFQERISYSVEGSSIGEDEDLELPSRILENAAEVERQRQIYFRQRSAAADGMGIGKKLKSFDVENGLHPSQSMLKLEELELAAQSSVSAVSVLKTLFFILVWYTFSTCLTLYNKTLLGDNLGKFPAPLLMNTFHFTLQAVLSKIIVCIQSNGSDTKVTMSWKDYFMRVVPTALGTALDINLSNASLVFISVTFATMCKSASPIFLLLFAFAFRLESPSINLLGIILIISFGVLLTVAKETEFQFWGFVFVMLAAVMSGFRWCMTQVLLQKESYGLKDPITLMSCVTPMMAVATLILSFLMDPWRDFDTNVYFDTPWHIMRSCLLMLTGGALAFFMVLTEYILISATSAVTVTIAGVVKEAVTIMVAVVYFHDSFTWLKGAGLLVILVGVSLFNWYKFVKLKKGHLTESSNDADKYVIIEDMESLDDDT